MATAVLCSRMAALGCMLMSNDPLVTSLLHLGQLRGCRVALECNLWRQFQMLGLRAAECLQLLRVLCEHTLLVMALFLSVVEKNAGMHLFGHWFFRGY